jgi:type II secretory pathway component GspD/PulD (secretin)
VDVVLGDGVDRRITCRITDATWLEAFEAVLDAGHLAAEWDGRRVRVLSIQALQIELQAEETLARERPHTAVFLLQNLPAEDAAATLQGILGTGGRIGIELERNALVVTDTPRRVAACRTALARLDRTPPQVMIEAIIVDLTLTDELRYGWDWSLINPGHNNFGFNTALSTGAGTNPINNPGGAINFAITPGEWNISALWDFIDTHDNVRVLANPKILALNSRAANIDIIDEIPYQQLTETGEGGQIGTTEFKEVGVKLAVTPRIAHDGTIHLELSAEQSTPTGAAVNQVPVINTRRAANVMTVRHGQTIVIGGLRRRRTITNDDKVPGLGDAPGLGGLFRRVTASDVDTELVIFIRPFIVPRGLKLTSREKVLAGALDHKDDRPLGERTNPLRRNVADEKKRRRTVP